MWAATHSERNFHDPYTFKSERWLEKENSVDKLGASNAFSLGPRGCIGKQYVMLSILSAFRADQEAAYRTWSNV
jgi:cytochrome P450